jgi:PTH2 family peptidyl-tRNA hydrolase
MSIPKQVIVIRRDLKMGKGKMAAQSSHASLGAILNYKIDDTLRLPEVVNEWINGIYTKICVYVDSEEELLDINNNAIEAGLNVKLIKDHGLTVFDGVHTLTCLAIGPDHPEKIDPITKHLKLVN